MRILVTGGAGYIGSQVVVELLEAGHEVVVLDDLSSGSAEALQRITLLTERSLTFHHGDVGNLDFIRQALEGCDAVIHLAAFKKVGESMERPGMYYRNNVGGMAALLEAMDDAGVRRILFSSTAAVYGSRAPMPLLEDQAPDPDSPYGLSKALGEQMLADMTRLKGWAAASLRYFNPVGAHASGRIGEPAANAASLAPLALGAIFGDRGPLTVFGTDYDTPDGTALRDYVHVQDLARAHVVALDILEAGRHGVYNVGTGRAHSVREVIAACERVTGLAVPHTDGPRRAGDVPEARADVARFEAATGFRATRTLDEMIASAWKWRLNNPDGYTDERAARRLLA